MRVRADDLPRQLSRGLAPVYLLSSDEPLLLGDARDAVRQAALAQGHTERVSLYADTGFDWNALAQVAEGMSLFAERRLIDLRLTTARPGDEGARVLVGYAERPPAADILLISAPQLDGQSQKTKWLKALDGAGVIVQLWPPSAAQLPGWIARRMRERGLEPSREAIAIMAERVEGNLLACANEIEKILLLRGKGPVDAQGLLEAITDSARFDIFDLVDGALGGDAARVIRILHGLEAEGLEPPLVLWALTRAIRFHAGLALAVSQGQNAQRLVQADRMWARRQSLVERALRRHSIGDWWHLLRRAAEVDRVTKGQAAGKVWDELLQLALSIAGIKMAIPAALEA